MARHYISTLKENLYLRAYSQIDETKEEEKRKQLPCIIETQKD